MTDPRKFALMVTALCPPRHIIEGLERGRVDPSTPYGCACTECIQKAHDLAVKEATNALEVKLKDTEGLLEMSSMAAQKNADAKDVALSDLKKAVEPLEWIVSQKKYFFAECDLAEQVIQKVDEALASLRASKEQK